jgi:hypothetical protein
VFPNINFSPVVEELCYGIKTQNNMYQYENNMLPPNQYGE